MGVTRRQLSARQIKNLRQKRQKIVSAALKPRVKEMSTYRLIGIGDRGIAIRYGSWRKMRAAAKGGPRAANKVIQKMKELHSQGVTMIEDPTVEGGKIHILNEIKNIQALSDERVGRSKSRRINKKK